MKAWRRILSAASIGVVLLTMLAAFQGFSQTQDTASYNVAPLTPDLTLRFVPVDGLGFEEDVCRRDPSDVIKDGATYFVWYTKVSNAPDVWDYPSGYSGTVWYATSRDGVHWIERGEALGKGGPGAFDEHGVFTPNILVAGGNYYLFYTGVPKPMSEGAPTAMGAAIAVTPYGPWRKSKANPLLKPSKDPKCFDSFRVDDSCLITRDAKYWLYYKGRQLGHSPAETKMGVAFAEHPAGPYIKYKGNPVVGSGHEVLVWPYREGVMALIGPTGPEKNTIQYAPDGLYFRIITRFSNPPRAPGAYRPDAFTDTKYGEGIHWGISMILGKNPYLERFECNLAVRK